MNLIDKVAVCSRSFSQNEILRKSLLSKYKNVTFNDLGIKMSESELIKFISGHTKAIIALESINTNILQNLPDLRVIGKYGVGLDMIDMNAMIKHNVRLGWRPGVNKLSVAELTLSLALTLIRKIPESIDLVKNKQWYQIIGNQLSYKKFGIIGCGNIGKELVKLLKPFSCDILVFDILDQDEYYKENNIAKVGLDDLLNNSDIISIHLPLNNSTKNILSSEKLLMMKSNVLLINVARGGLVDEIALKQLLLNNKIGAAAFDVFEQEPPFDNELLQLKNFFPTPHIGGSTEESILAMGMAAIEGLDINELPYKFI